jgi:hypothetical protein
LRTLVMAMSGGRSRTNAYAIAESQERTPM